MKNLSISYLRDGKQMEASIRGPLISLAAINLKTELHTKVDPWDRLIVDLTKVTEIDTTAINSLFQTQMRCISKNAKMILKCQKNHPVKRLLRLTHAEGEFDIVLA